MDIRAQNILFEFAEAGQIDSYLKDDAQDPLPHKIVSDRMIFMARPLSTPKALGRPVLADFGHARFGEVKHSSQIQPDAYRAPEVILEGEWDYSVDIWNVACLVCLLSPVHNVQTLIKEITDMGYL